MFKRVMIKISGEALSGEAPLSYNRELIEALGNEIAELIGMGIEPAVVTGAGNYWRGARSDERVDRVNSDHIGMLATAMNAVYIADCFASLKKKVRTELMSPVQLGGAFEVFNKQKADNALADGKALIFAYGTGHPYFSTDTSAALYGSQIGANAVLALKFGIDGVYTKDPVKFPDEAVFIEKITYDEIIKDKNLNFMDKAAACICKESGLRTIVLKFQKGNLIKAVKGEKVGTLCWNDEIFITP